MSDLQVSRQTLLDGDLLRVGYICAQAPASHMGELELRSANLVVLPLTGVFAKHDGPRRHVIGTPNQAVLIAADRPYRISYPGGVGDECLTLSFSNQALRRMLPRAALRTGFDFAGAGSQTQLPASAMIERSLLCQRLLREFDPLEIEELCISLLNHALHPAYEASTFGDRHNRVRGHWSGAVERVKEAVSCDPGRRWTLDALARVAGVSPYHLTHLFRTVVGTSAYRYVVQARLGSALTLVLETDWDLTAIALESGFSSHSHFTARFRAFFGTTPTDLRRCAKLRSVAEIRKIVTAPMRRWE